MKIEIIKKAWVVNASNLEEPWHYREVYHGTRGQARSMALIDLDNATLLKTGENVSFLTLNLVRYKNEDIIMYRDQQIPRYKIKVIDRNELIMNLSEEKAYYVQDKRNYVGNSVIWWALNGNGYTTNLDQAQKYTKKEVQTFINGRETDVIWDSEHVESVVKRHVDMQYLKTEFKT